MATTRTVTSLSYNSANEVQSMAQSVAPPQTTTPPQQQTTAVTPVPQIRQSVVTPVPIPTIGLRDAALGAISTGQPVFPTRACILMPQVFKEESDRQELFKLFTRYLEFEQTNNDDEYITHAGNLLVSSSDFFLNLRLGQEFIIAMHYQNDVFYPNDNIDDSNNNNNCNDENNTNSEDSNKSKKSERRQQLITLYSSFPKFIDVITNLDIRRLIDNYDNMTDEQLVSAPYSYKLTYYSKQLTDVQLTRLVSIINSDNYFDSGIRSDIDLWCLLDNGNETRYHILAADVLLDKHFEHIGLDDIQHDEFRKYILQHDKVPETLLCNSLSTLTSTELQFYDRKRLMNALCKLITQTAPNNDYGLIEEALISLKPFTTDDIHIIRDKRLCERVLVHLPEHTLLLCKRYCQQIISDDNKNEGQDQDESRSQHHLRLVRMLPNIHDHNIKFNFITDSTVECYISLDVIYPCQLYRMCTNKHYFLQSHYAQMDKKTCGVCRQDILPATFMNVTPEQFDDIFM